MKKSIILVLAFTLVCVFALCACTQQPAADTPATEEEPAPSESAATPEAGDEPAEATQAAADNSSLPALQIASKPMTEQLILVEMLKAVIEQDTEYTVELTKGIGGGTSNIQPAMEKGDFDMYPEYTSTGWEFVLKHEGERLSDDELFAQLQQEYQDQYGFEWVGKYGFGDQFGLAVKKEIADANNLVTYSDLAAITPDLIFAAEPDFYERDDGYSALCEEYGYNFKSTKDIDIGLKYTAINSGEVDVIDIFTTDGQLAVADVTVLQDDKSFFQSAYCYTVVRQDTLAQYPGLKEALMKMDGIVNEEEMTQMNYDVDVEGYDEKEVALAFLTAKGII
ncbi:glycine/betaine ABC transporter substrate-binding protein [Christensenellaceae bacterium OttesenSCG-928-K19]|nr:glycine/betaine ABC transporter substrate-binding protein [Christensenellaceae bacterium OttesenSCG-928-K19]